MRFDQCLDQGLIALVHRFQIGLLLLTQPVPLLV